LTSSYVYLLIAAVFQLAWLYNTKRIKKGIWKELQQGSFISVKNLKAILPIVLYIVFSIANIVFLTWAMKSIPASITYAIWTGIVIAGSTIIDQLLEKKAFNPVKYIFILMIVIGIIGLKLATK
jgi:multidrug transporter EmrE-like cation transporter